MNGDGSISLQSVLLLLLLLFPLIQLLVPALRRRLEELAREESAREQQDAVAPEVLLVRTVAKPAERATPAHAPRRARESRTAARAEEPQRRRRPLMDANDARRAIVAMAVLGSCKGSEPPRAPDGAWLAAQPPAQAER